MGFIGAGIDRKEGRAKVTGAAKYAAEFEVEGLAYAALVQSTVAKGTIESIDTSEAAKMPGVLLVITPDNALRLKVEQATQQTVRGPLLQDRVISFQGQHVAVVVAETQEQAQDAAGHVRVRYGEAAARTAMDDWLEAAIKPTQFRNGQRPPDSQRGDPDAAFASAAVKVEATYRTPIEHHNPMEPHATIAKWTATG